MSEHDETEILTDDQIEGGPAGASDRPWRTRLETSQAHQDLLAGVHERWGGDDLDRSRLDELIHDPDGLVAAISQSTGLTPEAVEHELDALTEP